MQVSLTATGGLERRLEVAIPASQVDGEVAQRLNRISRTARLKGFRPGKAPLAVIRQQYGDQVHGEVVSDTAEFSPAFRRAMDSGRPAVIELRMNPEQITTRATIAELRAGRAVKPAAKPKRAPAAKRAKPARGTPAGKKRGA